MKCQNFLKSIYKECEFKEYGLANYLNLMKFGVFMKIILDILLF